MQWQTTFSKCIGTLFHTTKATQFIYRRSCTKYYWPPRILFSTKLPVDRVSFLNPDSSSFLSKLIFDSACLGEWRYTGVMPKVMSTVMDIGRWGTAFWLDPAQNSEVHKSKVLHTQSHCRVDSIMPSIYDGWLKSFEPHHEGVIAYHWNLACF